MKHNSDFKYDLEIGKVAEKKLDGIFGKSKIEVKRDLGTEKTGNVFIEYYSRGKWSGISTTEAEWYCIFTSDRQSVLIATDLLKQKAKSYIGTNRDVAGGDNNTSKGVLIPVKELV